VDAISPVQQLTLMAQDLGLHTTFTIKITKEVAGGQLTDAVCRLSSLNVPSFRPACLPACLSAFLPAYFFLLVNIRVIGCR
jgi:hypothetical protein